MKIKNIITAIGQRNLNDRLKKENFNVLCTDIQYKEGILEYLEENKNVNNLIINEDLEGNIKIEDLLKKIKELNKNIKILIVSNKTLDEEKIILQLKNENKKIKPEIKKKISRKHIELNPEIIEKKEMKDLNSKNNINSSNIFNLKTLPINNLFYSEEKNNNKKSEIICILGPNGIGKSVFSILFAQSVKNKKSIIIDFDVLNKSLHTLLGIKNYEQKIKKGINKNDLIKYNQDFKKYIFKTNLNIDLLSGMNLILDSKYKLSYKKIKNIIEKLKEDYDIIIFDTSAESFLDYTKEIINLSNESIFISGANLLEIKKSQKLLEIYNKEWNINKNKFNIVFNKCTNKSIDDTVLKEIFAKYNIVGKIELSDYYDLLINKNLNQKNKLRKEIENIKKQIIKEKYYGISE